MNRPRDQRRAGLAAIFAVFMIGIVAISLAALATYFVADARRTRAAAEDAQLRQLLLAGAIVAVNDPTAKQVAMPAELEKAKVSLIHEDQGETASVRIVAELGKRHMEQTIDLARDGQRWQMTRIKINQPEASTQPSERSTAASQRS